MKIAITADPELPVPRTHYGGIERIVDMLIKPLIERGHEVTLIAHPGSASRCRLKPWPGQSSLSREDTIRNALAPGKVVAEGDFDLVHSFLRIAYPPPSSSRTLSLIVI